MHVLIVLASAALASKGVIAPPSYNQLSCTINKEICIHLFYSRESEYVVVCLRLLIIMITRINVQSFVDTYFVIQFENAGCLQP